MRNECVITAEYRNFRGGSCAQCEARARYTRTQIVILETVVVPGHGEKRGTFRLCAGKRFRRDTGSSVPRIRLALGEWRLVEWPRAGKVVGDASR